MKEYPAEFWNQRYGNDEYIYGLQPNAFIKMQIDELKPENILLPAEGEGRNAVYTALNGWKVTAFNISKNAREKALQLAKTNNVFIDFKVKNVLDFNIGEQFDVIGLSYAHFPAEIRKQAYQYLIHLLRPKGKIILEAFAKSQLENPSGEPKNVDLLFSLAEIEEEFSELKFEVLEQKPIELEEGENHKGKAEVIRFVGIK